MTVVISILLFFAGLFGLVCIRVKTGGKYEIKTTDMVTVLIPVGLWLLLSGRLVEFGVGDFKLKLQEVYKKPVTPLVTVAKAAERGGDFLFVGVDCKYVHEDDLRDEKTFPNYRPFKFIVINEKCEDDARGESKPIFVGLLSVDVYKRVFLSPGSKLGGDLFIAWVKSRQFDELRKFPSFVGAKDAVTMETLKLTALERMETLNVETLPIVDKQGQFVGVVDRARITASFLVDIGKNLK